MKDFEGISSNNKNNNNNNNNNSTNNETSFDDNNSHSDSDNNSNTSDNISSDVESNNPSPADSRQESVSLSQIISPSTEYTANIDIQTMENLQNVIDLTSADTQGKFIFFLSPSIHKQTFLTLLFNILLSSPYLNKFLFRALLFLHQPE